MKIGRVIPVFYPETTGPAYQAREISKGLIKQGHKSPVYATTRGAENHPRIATIDGVPVHRFPTYSGGLAYSIVPGLIPPLFRQDFDVIHAHGYRNPLTDIAFAVSQIRGIPFILHTHGTLLGYQRTAVDSPTWQYKLYDVITRRSVADRADHVVVSTTQERLDAMKFGIPEERISVIPVGKDVDFYQSTPRTPPEGVFRLLFVGRLAPGRNVEQVIKAMPELPSNVELRIVGEEVSLNIRQDQNYMDKLGQLVNSLGISDKVTFVGPKYDDGLVSEYRSADVFVYTSRYENFGQTILEAAAAGLPLVSTPVGVANDLIQDGKTGVLVPHGDSDAIVTAVESLMTADRGKKGERLSQRVSEEFTWETIIQKYEKLYTELI